MRHFIGATTRCKNLREGPRVRRKGGKYKPASLLAEDTIFSATANERCLINARILLRRALRGSTVARESFFSRLTRVTAKLLQVRQYVQSVARDVRSSENYRNRETRHSSEIALRIFLSFSLLLSSLPFNPRAFKSNCFRNIKLIFALFYFIPSRNPRGSRTFYHFREKPMSRRIAWPAVSESKRTIAFRRRHHVAESCILDWQLFSRLASDPFNLKRNKVRRIRVDK